MDHKRAKFAFEFLTYWGGGTTANELKEILGMSREAVQRTVIGAYQKQFPGAITYDRRKRRSKWGDSAALKLCPSEPAAILAIAQSEALTEEFAGVKSLCVARVEDVGLVTNLLIPMDVEPDLTGFQALFAGLMRRSAVQLDYLAKRGRLSMIFSPHTLVRTSFRLHFRGYCCDINDVRPGIYIDVVPDRILRALPLDPSSYVDDSGDTEWRRTVRIVVQLHENLPETVIVALRREYSLHEGHAWQTRPVKAAVAPYVMDAFEARRVHGWEGPVWRTKMES
jgi:hypothetical protein